MTKFLCLSDTHNQHDKVKMEHADVILHAGDYCNSGGIGETKAFLEWFSKQDSTHKILIDGNHCGLSEEQPALFKELLKEYPNITYLKDEMVTINNIKIWGRPVTPEFYDWWHMAPRGGVKMMSTLSVIPSNIDVLVTHGPPMSVLDKDPNGVHVGCVDLMHELDRIRPKVCVFGHLHNNPGTIDLRDTKFINCAVVNNEHKVIFSPVIFYL